MLQNSLAVAKMQQGLFEEAETHLNEALKHVRIYVHAWLYPIAVFQITLRKVFSSLCVVYLFSSLRWIQMLSPI